MTRQEILAALNAHAEALGHAPIPNHNEQQVSTPALARELARIEAAAEHGVDGMFPIIIPVTPAALEEFRESEWGAYEDAGCPAEGHVVTILERHKRKIEVRDAAEAELVYVACCSGTFQIREKGFLRTANKIADALRVYVSPRWLKLWDAPSGF